MSVDKLALLPLIIYYLNIKNDLFTLLLGIPLSKPLKAISILFFGVSAALQAAEPVVLTDFEIEEQGRVALPSENPPEKPKSCKSAKLSYSDEKAASGKYALRFDAEFEGRGYILWALNDFLTQRKTNASPGNFAPM